MGNQPHRSSNNKERSLVSQVAIPSEHGGWSLTIEPVILGLIVAWSPAGLALGFGAVLAFMARTPIKIVLVDLWRRRWLARSSMAAKVAIAELGLIGGLAGWALTQVTGRVWMPLVLAAGLVGVELWFDMRSRSRRLLPELAGAVGIGSVAAAIGLADNATATVAAGLWILVGARSVAAITFASSNCCLRSKLALAFSKAARV